MTSTITTGNIFKSFRSFRCHDCGRKGKQLYDALSKISKESAGNFRKFTKEQKQEFRERNVETLVQDLPAALQVFVTEARSITNYKKNAHLHERQR